MSNLLERFWLMLIDAQLSLTAVLGAHFISKELN